MDTKNENQLRIIQIIPGSGGSFYCGNCLRDSKFFDSLRNQGHKVVKIPMYLPLFSDEHDISDIPVFYGAISIYLKQLYPIFRKAPAWFDRMLNSKPMMKLAASMAGSTRAKGLEDMTVSMLMGEDGKQQEELAKMVDWIAEHCQPDVIHLSNALLLGLAKQLHEKTGAPVVCSLQDEDVWVDVMQPSFRQKVWDLMHTKSADVAAFVAVSDYYAKATTNWMNLPVEKVETVHLGVDPDDYEYINSTQKKRVVGYISRMCESNGLDLLVDAFVKLKEKKDTDDIQLMITGGATGDDTRFLKDLKKKIAGFAWKDDVMFWDEFEGEPRMKFLEQVSVVSVPVKNGEAFGIYLSEAMAAGIPVVQPALGAFPEIVNKAGGGVVYEPNEPGKLADALHGVLSDSEKLERLSKEARESVINHFNINLQGEKLVDIYKKVANK